MRPIIGCIFGVALAAALGAQAQEIVPTAPAVMAAPPVDAHDGPIRLSNERPEMDDEGPVPIGPCGLPYKEDKGGALKQDKSPHGAVWGGVGTHGYREAGGAVCVPVGEHAQVNIAVDAGHWDWGRR